jgi:hypothetical protein
VKSILASLCVSFLLAAYAQSVAAQGDNPSSDGASKTPSAPTDIAKQHGPLSDKLDRNQGVIHPEGGVDPGMEKQPPQTGATPIVRPPDPGKSGVQPK